MQAEIQSTSDGSGGSRVMSSRELRVLEKRREAAIRIFKMRTALDLNLAGHPMSVIAEALGVGLHGAAYWLNQANLYLAPGPVAEAPDITPDPPAGFSALAPLPELRPGISRSRVIYRSL